MPRTYLIPPTLLAALLGPATPAAGADPAYAVETSDHQTVVGVLTYSVSCRKMIADEWTVFAAVAPELPGQTGVKTALSPQGVPVKDRSPLARSLLVARVPAKTAGLRNDLTAKVTYQATLRARELKPVSDGAKRPRVPTLSAADRKAYTAEIGDIDFKAPAFERWVSEQSFARKAGEGDIDYARRVFLGIRDGFKYEFKADSDHKASAVCRAGRSDCGGLAMLYTAVLRANKVPARALFGRWAKSATAGEKLGEQTYYQWHVKAEFYADGVGWVPADIGQAVPFDRSPDGRKYFGNDPGDFLTFHVDPNVVVDTGPTGLKPVMCLQNPAWWVTGQGSVSPTVITEGWEVKNLSGKK